MKLFRITIENNSFYAQAHLLAIDEAGAMSKINKHLNEQEINIAYVNIKVEEFDVSKVIWDFE